MGLRRNARVYVDTNLFIYYFENNPQFVEKIDNFFKESIEKNVVLICSELLYLELLVVPFKDKNNKAISLYENIENYIPNLNLIPITKEILVSASKIRANYKYKPPDSIHLSTAKAEKCQTYYGSDKNLKSFKDVEILII